MPALAWQGARQRGVVPSLALAEAAISDVAPTGHNPQPGTPAPSSRTLKKGRSVRQRVILSPRHTNNPVIALLHTG